MPKGQEGCSQHGRIKVDGKWEDIKVSLISKKPKQTISVQVTCDRCLRSKEYVENARC